MAHARVRGETPLHRAAAWGSPEVIQLLLDAGADLTIRDANKDTPLGWASWYRRDKSIIDQLGYEGSGIGPDFPPGESGTQYQSASMFRELDVGQSALLTDIAMCINYYRLFSPGLYCCIHATVQLDDGTRFCPGVVVQVNHGPLKQCDPARMTASRDRPISCSTCSPETTCSTTNTGVIALSAMA